MHTSSGSKTCTRGDPAHRGIVFNFACIRSPLRKGFSRMHTSMPSSRRRGAKRIVEFDYRNSPKLAKGFADSRRAFNSHADLRQRVAVPIMLLRNVRIECVEGERGERIVAGTRRSVSIGEYPFRTWSHLHPRLKVSEICINLNPFFCGDQQKQIVTIVWDAFVRMRNRRPQSTESCDWS